MDGRNRSRDQRGSILVSAALIILVGILLLGGAQLGYFYYVKRELQKAADLGALTAAQMLDGTTCTWAAAAARANVRENLSGYADALLATEVSCYRWDPDNAALAPRFVRAPAANERLNAVRVQVTLPVSALFPYVSARTLQAEAVAARPAEPVAAFWVGTTLARTTGGVLTDLLKQVGLDLGGTSLAGYDAGLANVKITPAGLLKQLGIPVPANISLGDFNQLLAANTRLLGDVLDAVVTVAGQQQLLAANVGLLNAIRTKVGASDLALALGSAGNVAGLFANITGPDVSSALNVELGALDLLAAAIGVGTGDHAVVTDLSLPILDLLTISAKAWVIEPPSIGIGGVGTQAYTAQVRTFLRISTPNQQPVSLLGNLLSFSLNIPLTVDVVSGKGTITSLCTAKDAQNRDLATVRADSSLMRMCIGGPPAGADANWPFSTKYSCDDGYASQQLLKLSLLGVNLASLSTSKVSVPALAATGQADFHAGQTLTLPPGGNPLAIGTTAKHLTDALLALIVGNSLNNGNAAFTSTSAQTQLVQQLWNGTASTVCSANNASCRGKRLTAALNQIEEASSGLGGFVGGLTGSTLDILGSLLTLNIPSLLQGVGSVVSGVLGLVGGLLNGLLDVLGLNTCSGYLAGSETGCLNQLKSALSTTPNNAPGAGNASNAVTALVGLVLKVLQPALDAVGASVLQPLINDTLGLKVGLTDVHMLSVDCDGKGVQLVY
ncbi:TadG family pilus assembly protein [Bordetella genomosp. 12]|uniref:DUF2134 domain-containing protein n=1 Tax=Bordetella genomosp. 12 TaxID=463035 RepID=A0A261VVU9_9BORD|nr:TadG family pilus assembly protein [Bordetella genomosp. 12]OZI77937.1 hypothetical protein CAL22_05295 [Bordetella genomosp. 12]